MKNKNGYETIKRKYKLLDYIYYLQYDENKEDIEVRTLECCFMVWESSSFKVNGEEFSESEFYKLLDTCIGPVICNGIEFEKVGDIYISTGKI